jgi:hypothetical protein
MLVVVALAGLLSTACDVHTATGPGALTSITVTVIAGPLATIEVIPNPAMLAINQGQPFTTVGRDAGNNVVPITPSWALAQDGAAATISAAWVREWGRPDCHAC